VESGIAAARQIAGDKDVSIAGATTAAQALGLGLVDEVTISLVPVLMGKGIPYFASLAHAPHRFDDPVIIPGSRVTHLRYAVRRTEDRELLIRCAAVMARPDPSTGLGLS
jgi:hypothetical protein